MKMSILSSARRFAWSRSLHVNDSVEVEDSLAMIMSMPEFTFQDVDDDFLEEDCTTEMIQDWLKNCSIPDVLTFCQPDAETVLYNLGFASEKACSTYKIPSRFFFIPSKAKGIDFIMYFESLLQRIKRGDSSYIPADHEFQNDTLHPLHNSYPYIRTPGKTKTIQKHRTHFT
ncbi:protein TESPA1 [Dendrobates tinctorius]|uniref:protein TESPA1 n=1 Tax=Dendrobates tinctorius TaxID=92724 RepID=UPI003CC97267